MGIEKRIDMLGRVVVPIELRRKAGIELNSKVVLSFERGVITISSGYSCALCGARIGTFREYRLCEDCIDKIKNNI